MSSRFPHPWSKVAADYRRLMATLPLIVSNEAKNEFEDNFEREGIRTLSGVEPWAERQQEEPGTRRGILTKTGRLKRGLKAAPGIMEASVINREDYAQIHNEGGEMRGRARALSSNLKTRRERFRSSGGQAFMQARPFMVTTEPLMNDIEHIYFKEVESIWLRS